MLTDRLWAGAIAGGIANSLWGNKDESGLDRASQGALFGVALGGLSYAARPLAKGSWKVGSFATKEYFASKAARFSSLRAASVKPIAAGFHAYGSRLAFSGIGAVIGASVDRDHPGRGAMYGAAAGFGVRSLMHGASAYKALGRIPGGKWAAIAGMSALAFGLGTSMNQSGEQAAASYNPVTGHDDYDPSEVPDSGIRERLKNMNATGDIVLGAHGVRRR